MAKLHWTQTPEGRAKMSVIQKNRFAAKRNQFRELAKQGIALKKSNPIIKNNQENIILVINGWRFSFDKKEIRITRE